MMSFFNDNPIFTYRVRIDSIYASAGSTAKILSSILMNEKKIKFFLEDEKIIYPELKTKIRKAIRKNISYSDDVLYEIEKYNLPVLNYVNVASKYFFLKKKYKLWKLRFTIDQYLNDSNKEKLDLFLKNSILQGK